MILQVNKMYEPDIGGVETVVKDYSELLNKYENVNVLCISKTFKLKTKIEKIRNVKIYRCSSFGTFLSMPISLSFIIYFLVLQKRARVIHFHEPFPLGTICSLFLNKKKRIFITWHSDIVKQKKLKIIMEIFQKHLCNKADKIITTSPSMFKYSKILHKYKAKTIIIPLSLNRKEYNINFNFNIISTDILNLKDGFVLYLGRFSYYKGLDVLIESIYLLNKEIYIVIVGEGELSEYIRKKIYNNKNVKLLNRFVNEEEKKYLLNKCKFLVFPSTLPSEAFGIIQLEAMAYGKPIINTNLPTGVPWVSLHDISGLTVKPNDKYELANAIKQLYYDDIIYKRLSTGALDRLNNYFTKEKTDNSLINLYFK